MKDLIARMRLDTVQFQNGLRGVENRLREAGARLRSAGEGMSLAITAPVLAVTAATKSAADALAQVQNQAALAGMTAQQFKVLAMASDDFGIGQDALADILKDVNERLGEFRQTGGGPMKDFFDNIAPKVGLTADAFRDLNAADALQLYVSSLEKAGVGQAEMGFYLGQMAGEAALLAPVFRDGGRAIDEMTARAQRLGLRLDDDLIKSARRTSAEFQEVKEVLGLQMQQALVRLAPAIQQMMATAVPLVERISAGVSGLADGFARLDPSTQTVVVSAVAFGAALGPLAMALGAVVSGLGVATTALRVMGAAALANPVVAVVAGIAAGAYLIYQNWEGISAFFGGLWDNVTSITSAALESVKSGLSAAWDFIAQTFMDYHPIGVIISNWDGITGYFSGLMGRVSAAFSAGWDAIIAYLQTLPERFVALGGEIVEGLKAGIMAKWDAMVGWFKGRADALVADFKSWFDIQSPSRVFRKIGQWITEGLGLGIRDNGDMVGDAMQGVADRIGGTDVTQPLYQFRDAASDVFSQVALQGESLGAALKSTLGQWMTGQASSLFTAGFNGLWGALGLPAFANGAAFSGGQVMAFANGGVVSGPTTFAMRNGTGLMGEAGPEAILPLSRGAGGKLGVRSQGQRSLSVSIGWDASAGDFIATVRDEAGRAVAQARPGIMRDSVAAVQRANKSSRRYLG